MTSTATIGLLVALLIGTIALIVCLIGMVAFMFNHIVTEIRKDHDPR